MFYAKIIFINNKIIIALLYSIISHDFKNLIIKMFIKDFSDRLVKALIFSHFYKLAA